MMLSDSSSPTLQMARMACYSAGGAWGPGRCPSASRLGGCQLVENETIWFYPSAAFQTTDQVVMACTSKGGTFLPP
jgi:hypothetical protein